MLNNMYKFMILSIIQHQGQVFTQDNNQSKGKDMRIRKENAKNMTKRKLICFGEKGKTLSLKEPMYILHTGNFI